MFSPPIGRGNMKKFSKRVLPKDWQKSNCKENFAKSLTSKLGCGKIALQTKLGTEWEEFS